MCAKRVVHKLGN